MSEALSGLEQLARDRTEKEGLAAALTAIAERAEQARQRVVEARSRLADEQADVAALETMSMTRILAALRGRRDAELDREQAEAVAAEYAVAEAEARAAAEDREVASVEARIAAHGDLDARRTELLAQRELEVRDDPASAATSEQLTELVTLIGELYGRRTQLEEADAAARAAHEALDEAARHLGSAGSWATYDTFFGGGFVADLVKHDKLDRAGGLMRQADAALGSLATELADVGISGVEGIGITDLTRALDCGSTTSSVTGRSVTGSPRPRSRSIACSARWGRSGGSSNVAGRRRPPSWRRPRPTVSGSSPRARR